MTPSDVLDHILHDERLPARGNFVEQLLNGTLGTFDPRADVLLMHGALMTFLRPDTEHRTPLSPLEVRRLTMGLRIILEAVEAAHARKPAHFCVVPEVDR